MTYDDVDKEARHDWLAEKDYYWHDSDRDVFPDQEQDSPPERQCPTFSRSDAHDPHVWQDATTGSWWECPGNEDPGADFVLEGFCPSCGQALPELEPPALDTADPTLIGS